ncbi:MAG: hypothetical protein CME70_11690 [Halobacteriovorax sp.]|nr:hypothetical protein [Halobacteriovorax sp.]|tara:strand:+ start:21174 stop:21596 length:423 start_codon:yes stop_codon:yes gene_type:complete
MDELTYRKDGLDVKTSKFLRNRGSCCKTKCLHCPYGFTLEKEGLKIIPIDDSNFEEAKKLIPKNESSGSHVAASLLASAFGDVKPIESLTEANKMNYSLVTIKDETCALIKKNQMQAIEIFHADHFGDQGITLDIVNTYF